MKPKPGPGKPDDPAAKAQEAPAPQSAGATTYTRPSGTRETIESIVVAFVLAFLFKTFEAEAFVIPTGSMAPTLQGRHKDVHCPKCGIDFRIGASDEVESETDYVLPHFRIRSAVCPNCRYRLDVMNLPAFKGDRILVTKFSYEVSDPHRWDVGVFKFPEEPKVNYIKRIVGLPNETIEIRQGDVYQVSDKGTGILRKSDPNKQRAIQLLVYDNDHPEQPLLDAGWPERWSPVKKAGSPEAIAGWSPDNEGWVADARERSFHLPAERSAGSALRWLRYRNIVPGESAWQELSAGGKLPSAKPKLITDFCGYNAFSNGPVPYDDYGLFWVGDLTINCRVDLKQVKPDGQLVLELNEGPRVYRCRFDLTSGRATLVYSEPHDSNDPGEERQLATADTRVIRTGQHEFSFANVDDRLCLWVDGRLIDFGEAASYQPYGGLPIQRPWDEDLIPVGVAVRGAEATVSHLLLQRDIYYRCEFVPPSDSPLDNADGLSLIKEYDGDDGDLVRKADNPTEWFHEYESKLSSRMTGPGDRYKNVSFQFTMGDDEFFMMGDNSPRSKDSRLWSNKRHATHRHAVPRIALVGKAFFVYWPHGIPFMDNGRGYPDGPDSIWNNSLTARFFYNQVKEPETNTVEIDTNYPKLRIPFYPNVSRMRRIR